MPITEQRTVLKDRQGKEHKYYTTLLTPDVGFDLLADVQDVVLQLFGHGVGSLKDRLNFLESEINSGEVIQALSPVVQLLLRNKTFRLDIFSATTRDGNKLDQYGINEAYQGNYGEYYAACIWLIKENFLLPLVDYLTHLLGASQLRQIKERFKAFWSVAESGGISGD